MTGHEGHRKLRELRWERYRAVEGETVIQNKGGVQLIYP